MQPPTNPLPLADIAYWRAAAEAELCPSGDPVERNAAITARYARWYLSTPTLFKWAGMAAFASHQVGIAIRLDEDFAGSIPDLDLIRETNDKVFADVAWAHLAYDAGGSAAVVGALANEPEDTRRHFGLLVDGFRLLHEGQVAAAAKKDTEARKLVWKGSLSILEHEQRRTVQPQFEKLAPPFSWALSLATSMEFHPKHHGEPWENFSWFNWYMWTFGIFVLARTMSFPDVIRFEHRWFWIRTRLLPLWQRLDTADRWLDDELKTLVATAPAVSTRVGALGTRPTQDPTAPPPPPPSS